VTSDRQRAANRANSGMSTGPRTKAGKSVARLNARLHGIATAVQSEPGADAEIERLARAIADEAGRPDLIEFARRIAEAEVDLRRIRRSRETLAKFPPVVFAPSRMAQSPNRMLFTKALKYENQRKDSSFDNLKRRLYRLGWDPDAPEFIEKPLKSRVLKRSTGLKRLTATSGARRRGASRRSADLTR
jgi:hypothetical protein